MKIVLTGGGSGGHIYPALSLWNHLSVQQPDAQVLYIGTEKALERDIVLREGIQFEAIPAAGLRRQLSISALKTALTTYRGYLRAKRILKRFKPDVVLGTGGYVTLPVIFAANKLGIPSVIWEGNARPGLTNQLCARKADAVALAFDGSQKWFPRAKRLKITGNPRASEVLTVSESDKHKALRNYEINDKQKVIVIFSGSQGSSTVNQVVTELLPRFKVRSDWRVLFVTGERHYNEVEKSATGLPKHVSILPFIYDMPGLLPNADVVITRAGSSTLAEICSLGVASILIPSPYVPANHQEENAKRLAERGAAVLLLERDLTADTLWSNLVRLLDGHEAENVGRQAKAMATPNAVGELYELVMEVSKEKK